MFPFAKQLYQRQTIELALAKHIERQKKISAVFEPASQIKDHDIRRHLLNHVAGPIILKMQATDASVPQAERDAALLTLLTRDLTQARFKGFVEDIKLLPPKPEASTTNEDGEQEDIFAAFRWESGNDEGYECPAIVQIAESLAKSPKDVKARLCLGDFFRVTGVSTIEPAADDELGSTGTLFAGAPLARMDFYRDIMANSKASHADRAYAVYRAIHCYQPVGNNACGGKDVSKATRKAWFNELKAKYGDTSWGRDSVYYW
jgi:hypothetical protein